MVLARMLGVFLLVFFMMNEGSAKNLGHRVGGGPKEFFKDLPENSLSALKAALIGRDEGMVTPLQYHPKWDYTEFDIQETKDNEIILFHDKDLMRMLPYNEKNKAAVEKLLGEINKSQPFPMQVAYKDLKVKDLTLDQIKTLTFDVPWFEPVPTLKEFLDDAHFYGLEKPLTVEIKYLHSDKARHELIRLVKEFREKHLERWEIEITPRYDMSPDGIGFLAFPRNFKKSFGKKRSKKRKFWCNEFKKNGFKRIYRTIFHSINLCK